MEMWSIGFLLGAVFSLAFIGIGVCFGRSDKGISETEYGRDPGTRIYIPCRDRDRSSMGGDDECPEQKEIIPVLESLRLGSSRTEREALDIAIQYINYAEEVRGNAME